MEAKQKESLIAGFQTPLQNTDVHLIIKLLHADTCTHSHTDKPLTLAAGFLSFIERKEKNGNIAGFVLN